jgi:DNA-directed RNA polymerase
MPEIEPLLKQTLDTLEVTHAIQERHARMIVDHEKWLEEQTRAIARHDRWLAEHEAAMQRLEKLIEGIARGGGDNDRSLEE